MFKSNLFILGLFASIPLIASKAVECKSKLESLVKKQNLTLVFFFFSISISASGRLGGRIFKGEYDLENEHRYHVAVLEISEEDTTKHICGGAIIDSHHVLTAAHCVYGRERKELVIRSGWNKNPEVPELEKRIYHKIAKIMYLKDYFHSNCRSHEHDIAIIKVCGFY